MPSTYTWRSVSFTSAVDEQFTLFGNDARRLALMFNVQFGVYTVHYQSKAAFFDPAFGQVTTNVPLVLLWKDWGTLVQSEWFAFSSGGGAIITATELIKV